MRFVLELLFVFAVLWNIFEEGLQLMHVIHDTGHASNYFKETWNWIDMLCIAIQIVGIGLWSARHRAPLCCVHCIEYRS